MIVVRPTGRHLAELLGRVPAMVTIDPAKEQRLHRAPDSFFEVAVTEQVEYTMPPTEQKALDPVGMAPSARHLSRAAPNGDGLLPEEVTAYRSR